MLYSVKLSSTMPEDELWVGFRRLPQKSQRSMNFSFLILPGDHDQESLHSGDILEVRNAVTDFYKAYANYGSWLLLLMSVTPLYQQFLSVIAANHESETNEDVNRMEKSKEKKQCLANDADWHVTS